MGRGTSTTHILATVPTNGQSNAVIRSVQRAANALPATNRYNIFDPDVKAEENVDFFEEMPLYGINRPGLFKFFQIKPQRTEENKKLRQYLSIARLEHGADTTAAYAQALKGWWPKDDLHFKLPNVWFGGYCYYIVNKRLMKMKVGGCKGPILLGCI